MQLVSKFLIDSNHKKFRAEIFEFQCLRNFTFYQSLHLDNTAIFIT